MFRVVAVTLCAVLSAGALSAQVTAVMTGDGWEAFPRVQYTGGHASFPRPMWGVLVLTDSSLSFHPCGDGRRCEYVPRGKAVFKDTVIFTMRLTDIRELTPTTRTVGPGLGRRAVWGVWANDRSEETIEIRFATDATAEAPTFRTGPTQSASIDAKVRFRMERLRSAVPPGD